MIFIEKKTKKNSFASKTTNPYNTVWLKLAQIQLICANYQCMNCDEMSVEVRLGVSLCLCDSLRA